MKYFLTLIPFLAMANPMDFLKYKIECHQQLVEECLDELREDLMSDSFTLYEVYYMEGQRRAFQDCLDEIEKLRSA